MSLRRLVWLVLLCAAVGTNLGNRQAPSSGDLIDSVLAVVENQVIMRSDVRIFVALGLIEPPESTDLTAAVLTALIERRLILEEVARYVVEAPSSDEVDVCLARIVARVGGPVDLNKVLLATGFTGEDLREVIRDDLLIERYLARRFVSARQPDDVDVATYFRDHVDEFRVDGVPQSFDSAQEEVRRRLSEQLRQELIDDWVASLMVRADVIRVAP